MSSNISEQEFLNAERSLDEPHFDEESTVLSARPVVPLEDIKAHSQFRRPWVFGLAIAGALLLGAVATAFYFSRQNVDSSTAFADTDAITAGVQALAAEPDSAESSRQIVTDAAPRPVTPTPKVENPSNDPAPVAAPKSSKKPVPRLVDVITTNPGRYSEDRIREERKAARREEKQRRREARREARGEKSPDDLMRIREIFEGRRRP